ncbi:MAG: stage III sporulation protein AD [Clostridiales bacterium]|uniref:Stage III sporulation protein AD n=1 Tax=Harryflintia acetispora TaxID=1849041 RepID=A0A9X8UJG3_9FIRM|nr:MULTISPECIES: SpoIIIAC/SpoIIIAD family protein [Oscillospiraceae]PWM41009.1 MAG: stage III sporulation protein AD [Clostridiales bacterium]RGB66483.1 stage III sporulation protein AD [Harryflintia acetispora]TCL43540.1 stage III sporulation protein AD [Harryflintia acetispora]
MELTAIVGLAIVAVCIVVLLRQYKPEYALMVSLICSVVIFAAVLGELIPAFDTIRSMMQQVQIDGQYIEILLKSLGICFITQIASESCRDAGESAIASKIELAGKLMLVVLALPMFEEIVSIALGFMAM